MQDSCWNLCQWVLGLFCQSLQQFLPRPLLSAKPSVLSPMMSFGSLSSPSFSPRSAPIKLKRLAGPSFELVLVQLIDASSQTKRSQYHIIQNVTQNTDMVQSDASTVVASLIHQFGAATTSMITVYKHAASAWMAALACIATADKGVYE